MGSDLRLIKGRDGWWALFGASAAHLPEHAVVPAASDSCSGEPLGIDRVRSVALVEEALDELMANGFFEVPTARNFAVTVLTATACNLGCNYCFQNTALAPTGSYAPPRIAQATLNPEMVDATVSFVATQQRSSGLETVSLLIFGGEPLLNPDGCIQLLRGLQRLHLVDAEIVTNGVLLTPALASNLHEHGLRRVQITFDGPRRTHDSVRVTRNGRPTYDAILRNVKQAAALVPDLAWNFRVNVSHHNVAELEELIADLASVCRNARRVTLHLALIDDVGLGYENAVGYDTDLADRFSALNRTAIASGMRVQPSVPLSDCPYCGIPGGSHGAVINADGRLFSCWENAGREGWDVGHVSDGYGPEAIIEKRWVACDFDTKSHGDRAATRSFFDRIDADALDDQRSVGRLVGVTPS